MRFADKAIVLWYNSAGVPLGHQLVQAAAASRTDRREGPSVTDGK